MIFACDDSGILNPSESLTMLPVLEMQFDNDVLLKEDFYNGIINLRIGKIKLS